VWARTDVQTPNDVKIERLLYSIYNNITVAAFFEFRQASVPDSVYVGETLCMLTK
jgi:hypothetical protein